MKKSGKDSELDAMLSNLESLAGPETIIFRTTGVPEEYVLLWDGPRIEDFFKVFHQTGKKMLYLRQETVDNEDDAPGHVGEICQLDVAFLDEGHFHNFRRMADWFEEMCLEDEPVFITEEQPPHEVLVKLDKIIEEMLKELPAKKWTQGTASDYCLEHNLPHYYSEMLYHRIKRRLMKEAGDGAKGDESEGQNSPGREGVKN